MFLQGVNTSAEHGPGAVGFIALVVHAVRWLPFDLLYLLLTQNFEIVGVLKLLLELF